MSKTKCIPFLALVAMLSACTLGNGNAKMKKYSKEVTAEDWNTNMNAALNGETVGSGDVNATVNLYFLESVKSTLGKENLGYEEMKATGTMKGQYDADSNIGKFDMSIKGKMKAGANKMSMGYDVSGSKQRYYQTKTVTQEVDGVETEVQKTIGVNTKQKEYYFENDNVQTMTLYYALMPLLAFGFLPANYEYAEDKDNFHFYQDSKMFTCEYSKTTEEEQKETIDGQETVYRRDKEVKTDIIQMEYKKSGDKLTSFTVRYEQKKENTKTYAIDYNEYHKDQIVYDVQDMIFDAKFQIRDVTFEAINLDGYIDGGNDVDVDLGD